MTKDRPIGPGNQVWDGLLGMSSDRPSRRLQATRQAPRRATPCQDSGPPDCLRKLRQTGSVAPFEFRPLRSRPRSATAPFAPKQRGPRACGAAAGCTVPRFTTAGCSVNSATSSVPLAGMVTLRYRLRGATGRLGLSPSPQRSRKPLAPAVWGRRAPWRSAGGNGGDRD